MPCREATTRDPLDTLQAWRKVGTWAALVAACLILAAADRVVPEAGMAALFIPLITLAGWRLGPREACSVALAAALLNVSTPHAGDAGLPPVLAILRGILRLGTNAFVVWAVCTLRSAYDRERTAARHDGLTGALNRAAFEEHARSILEAEPCDQRVTVLALADIDDFKVVNDTGGHAAGDAVLRAFAEIAAASLDGRERLGRLGGDEFVLLLEADTAEAARSRIEAVHRRLTDDLWSAPVPATASIGALVLQPERRHDWVSALKAADHVMYAVKASGKNALRVEISGMVAASPDMSRLPARAFAVA